MALTSSLLYLISSILFILSIYGLASPKTAITGNRYGIIGMSIAILTTLFLLPNIENKLLILYAIASGGIVGSIIALKIKMTSIPQLVAGFHSLIGLSAILVASAALWIPDSFSILDEYGNIHKSSLFEMGLAVIIGAITFSGSIIAFLKLNGNIGGKPLRFKGQKSFGILLAISIILLLICFLLSSSKIIFIILSIIAIILGFFLILPIGGADMPVVISMLNSYSGWAAVGIGFTLGNNLLIITGAIVGASGAILSYIMCKAMNRSIINVIFGGFEDNEESISDAFQEDRPVKKGNADDVAFMMQNASSIIIVPGYGMAVAGAQHAVSEMANMLEKNGVKVRYAIHPVAGRMPGHMNVLLAEAGVDYENVFELEEINNDFKSTDIVYVIGANDITNPAAKTDKSSPIYGMPILDVENSASVIFVKRSMATGYAGVQNELFFRDNTMMVFGDAKKVTESIIKNFDE